MDWSDLQHLSYEERKLALKLREQIRRHFQGPLGAREPFRLGPDSVDATRYTDRVTAIVMKRATDAGWIAELDKGGVLTVRAPVGAGLPMVSTGQLKDEIARDDHEEDPPPEGDR
jgi:hypothetical protein